MTWVKKDDQYPLNRKIRKLTDAEYRLDDSAMCWSARNGTDGHIPPDELPFVSEVRNPTPAAAGLVKKERWHQPGHDCKSEYCRPIEDGWLIHDYLDYNPTAETIQKRRQERAQAGRRGGRNSSKRRANLKAVGEANA